MSTRSLRTPSYRLHKPTGQAVVTINDKDFYLGRHGTPESRSKYDQLIAEWLVNKRCLPPASSPADGLTLNEVILAYWHFVEGYYRHKDGTPTSEVNNIRQAIRSLRRLYGHTAACVFDSAALETVRQAMIDQGLSRKRINKDVARIKRLFKWAVVKKLVPASILPSVQAVEGLRAGRSAARETEPVKPVAEEHVRATHPFLSAKVRAMTELQLLAGMRPGEVIIMRGCDLNITGQVWTYTPNSHKTEHYGHQRVICLGPKAQEVVKPFLKTDLQAYLFSPKDARQAWFAARRKDRKSPMTPSQAKRKPKKNPKNAPGDRYLVSSYSHAVARACEKARVPHWHPHQIRHTRATEIRAEYGLNAARVVLGHRSPQITEVYAEIDVAKAAEVMGKIG